MIKRRNFLAMLGFAPVVAAVPAVAGDEIGPFAMSTNASVRDDIVSEIRATIGEYDAWLMQSRDGRGTITSDGIIVAN